MTATTYTTLGTASRHAFSLTRSEISALSREEVQTFLDQVEGPAAQGTSKMTKKQWKVVAWLKEARLKMENYAGCQLRLELGVARACSGLGWPARAPDETRQWRHKVEETACCGRRGTVVPVST